MPNWVRNRLRIIDDNYQNIINRITTYKNKEDGFQMDFEKIIPMPESIRNTELSTTTPTCMGLFINSIKKTPDFQKYITALVLNKGNFVSYSDEHQERLIEEMIKNNERFKTKDDVLSYGKQCFDNLVNYGVIDWYEWSMKNWGTKWNASRTEINGNEIIFETPWDPVPELIKLLSKDYPNVVFEYDYSDEQICVYCGEIEISNGEYTKVEQYEDGSKEAYEKGFELWPYSKRYFKFDKKSNNYQYIQNVDDSGME